MTELRARSELAARALELTILTACRTSEVLEAHRREMDGDLWTVPASRTKTRKPHIVPLTPGAVAIIEGLPALEGNRFLFPGMRENRPLSGMSMLMLMRRMNCGDFTVHGFRSSFRDWAAECTSAPREIAELCLAHQVGSEVERAYRRSDLLAKRRSLMRQWADFCDGKSS